RRGSGEGENGAWLPGGTARPTAQAPKTAGRGEREERCCRGREGQGRRRESGPPRRGDVEAGAGREIGRGDGEDGQGGGDGGGGEQVPERHGEVGQGRQDDRSKGSGAQARDGSEDGPCRDRGGEIQDGQGAAPRSGAGEGPGGEQAGDGRRKNGPRQ